MSEKFNITPSQAAEAIASYLSTIKDGEELITYNKQQVDELVNRAKEDMMADREGEYDTTVAVGLIEEAAEFELQAIEAGYRVENAQEKAKQLYQYGADVLQEAALAGAALAGVEINLDSDDSK